MTQTEARRPAPRAPRVTLAASQVERLEALADGATRRAPELAERLLDELNRARVVPDARLPRDVVALGRTVTYRDEESGRETTVTLVLPEEADIARHRASVLTPVGVALIGLAEGSSFSWTAGDGRARRLTVTRVTEPADQAAP
jgi:regulator of nucleoside diphosphate kinase